jgi:hypothetical protein
LAPHLFSDAVSTASVRDNECLYRSQPAWRWNIWFQIMTRSVFWDITQCSPLKVNWRFGRACRPHLRNWRISQARNQRQNGWQILRFQKRQRPTDIGFSKLQ